MSNEASATAKIYDFPKKRQEPTVRTVDIVSRKAPPLYMRMIKGAIIFTFMSIVGVCDGIHMALEEIRGDR